jgi:hypothetical protein
MRISTIRRHLYQTAKILGDIQAICKGRVGQRLAQRHAGKLTRKALNKTLRRLG